jgi:arylsulfatase A-like enzyme
MIEHLDRETGRLLGGLDRLGLTEETIVIFVSDNGGAVRVTRNDPLRRGKATCYEGGIRVPMIVRWPDRIESGRICEEPVHIVDLFPTLLQAAGGRRREGQILDGVSLMPLLEGGAGLERRALYFHIPHYICYPAGHFRTTPHGAVRLGALKLVEHFGDHFAFPPDANRGAAVYDPNLAEYVPERKVELFNLGDDIGEHRNLAGVMPRETDELLSILRKWRESIGAAMPVPNPDYDPAARFVSEFDSARARKH